MLVAELKNKELSDIVPLDALLELVDRLLDEDKLCKVDDDLVAGLVLVPVKSEAALEAVLEAKGNVSVVGLGLILEGEVVGSEFVESEL